MPDAANADRLSQKPELQGVSMRVLAEAHAQLVEQIAEITVAQRLATKTRKETALRIDAIESGLARVADTMPALLERQKLTDDRVAAMEQNMARNTDMTAELLSVISAVKGGFKVLAWLGTAGKVLAGIAAGAAALYALLHMVTHGGQPPK